MNINYETILWISKASIVISFLLLCIFIIVQFYFSLYDTIENENLKDAINETLEMVNTNE